MLRFDASTRQYVGQRVRVDAAALAEVQAALVRDGGLAPEAALRLLLDEHVWVYDSRARRVTPLRDDLS